MFPLASLEDSSFGLGMCVYTMSRDTMRIPKVVNTRTGKVQILTAKNYASLLSQRELEVLKLTVDSLLNKEIAEHLSISVTIRLLSFKLNISFLTQSSLVSGL